MFYNEKTYLIEWEGPWHLPHSNIIKANSIGHAYRQIKRQYRYALVNFINITELKEK